MDKLRRLWRRTPTKLRRPVNRGLRSIGVRVTSLGAKPPAPIDLITTGPVVISGFFSDSRGISQAAHLTATMLEQAGFCVKRHDVTALIRGDLDPPEPPSVAGGVWIIHANPPEMRIILDRYETMADGPFYRIGYWAWELSRAPQNWLTAGSAVHEIWTPSHFSAAALSETGRPITVMPHPVGCVWKAASPAKNSVTLAILADFRSSSARKNPLGALTAYTSALPAPTPGVKLVVKITAPEADPSAFKRLNEKTEDRPDIFVITRHLDADEQAAFLDNLDILISLHRSEGFGLVLAETMARGKVVVATGWSGNMEFMSEAHDVQIVPHRLIAVADASGRYNGGSWAEPDLDGAAVRIQRLVGDKDLRLSIAATNRHLIHKLSKPWTQAALAKHPFSAHATRSRLVGDSNSFGGHNADS